MNKREVYELIFGLSACLWLIFAGLDWGFGWTKITHISVMIVSVLWLIFTTFRNKSELNAWNLTSLWCWGGIFMVAFEHGDF